MRTDLFRPMLAAALARPLDADSVVFENLKRLNYPVYATPKEDGIRLSTTDDVPGPGDLCVAKCRSLLPLPNDYARNKIQKELPPGLDGELLTYSELDLLNQVTTPKGFHDIQSDLMSVAGKPSFKYHIFDYGCCFPDKRLRPYIDRVQLLALADLPDWCVKLIPTRCDSVEDLQAYYAKCLADGHEGICFRTASSPAYKITSKDGRSTLREQWLVKWKMFSTSEAEIIAVEEEMQNNNAPVIGLKGLQERSSHKGNMVGKNRLGALVVKTPTGIVFRIGSGFTGSQRENLWTAQAAIIGKQVTYRHQPHGEHEAPRIPIFVGIRSKIDMS